MNAICVDDEPLIQQLVVSLCREMPLLDGAEGFSYAQDALDWLDCNQAEIALLDIDMPEMNGIELAAKIREKYPDNAVIFLTGYAQFAVDAFALHASGYLLKPISREKLYTELEYAIMNFQNSVRQPHHIRVQTFGNFMLEVDGTYVAFERSKAMELLAFLVDRQGSGISRMEAFAALWEDGLYDRSMQKQLDVIIRSLRATLQKYDAANIFDAQKGKLRVRPELLDCDLYHFLEGDPAAIYSFRGEYMSAYDWARPTEGYLLQIQMKHMK